MSRRSRLAATRLAVALFLLGPPAAVAAAREKAPAAGAASAPASAAVAGGSPSVPFTAELDVRLVELEVSVTGADGLPVHGLSGDDFRLFEDGNAVIIQHLSELGEAAVAGGAPAGTAARRPAGPTHLVVFLDELHTTPALRSPLYLALGRGLAEQLPAGARVMVARYEGGLQVLLPFTDEGPAILDAFEAATGFVSAQALRGEAERVSVLDAIHEDAREGPCLYGDQLARQYGERLRADAQQLLRTLDGMVGALDTVPGRKVLLYVGDGVPPRPGAEALEAYIELCGGDGVARGVEGALDTATFGAARFHRPDPQKLRLEAMSYDMGDDWQRLAARANGVGVPLHALTLRSAVASASSIEANERGPSAALLQGEGLAANDVTALLTDATGGRLWPARGPVGEQLEAMVAPRQGYLLGFAASQVDDPRPRRLRLEVARPGVRVRHRQSYAPVGGVWRVIDRLLAALYLGAGNNPLQLVVESKKARGEAGQRLRLELPLARLTLLPAGDGAAGRFTIFVVTVDAAGALSPVREKEVPVMVPPGGLLAAQRHSFTYEVTLPSGGEHRAAAIGVRDELSGELAFVRVPL